MSMVSTPRRRRLSSQAFMRWWRGEPSPLGPSSIRNVALVEIRTRFRLPSMAFPRISSDRPREYTSAVSKRFTPASRQISTRRLAPATSVLPQALKNSLPPPKVPVPNESTGTSKPEEPSCLNSMLGRCQQDYGGFARTGGEEMSPPPKPIPFPPKPHKIPTHFFSPIYYFFLPVSTSYHTPPN